MQPIEYKDQQKLHGKIYGTTLILVHLYTGKICNLELLKIIL